MAHGRIVSVTKPRILVPPPGKEPSFDITGIAAATESTADGTNGAAEENPRTVDSQTEPPALQPPTTPGLTDDVPRHSGDTSLYKVYLSSAGWLVVAVFLSAAVLHAGLEKAPRENQFPFVLEDLISHCADTLSNCRRDLAQSMGRVRGGKQ